MTEEELDDLLSTPRTDTVTALEICPGDIVILGAGGKMGPTLARMAIGHSKGRRRRRGCDTAFLQWMLRRRVARYAT